MINILEILKKIPNLEDMVFYSPLYGDVKVRIFNNGDCPINLYAADVEDISDSDFLVDLTKEGYYDNISFGERECMLYPSRQNKDWSIFKISRKDLPNESSVMVSQNKKEWYLNTYNKEGRSSQTALHKDSIPWNYIIPVDKFNFKDWSFKEEDNYGTTYKS